MIPILYNADEKTFRSNGLGALTDAVSCCVDQEINGGFELEMRYSVDGIHFKLLRKNRIILAKTDSLPLPQPFRIYRISKEIGGTVMVYARHMAYDLKGIPVAPFSAKNAKDAMGKIQSNAVAPCSFSLSSEISTDGTMEIAEPKDAWALIGKNGGGILSVYQGELEFDRFSIKLKKRLGANRGAVLRYGKNLQAFQQDENCGDVYTGIYPYWKNRDGEITTLPEKTVDAAGSFDHVKIKPVDFSPYFDSAPTSAQLRKKASDYIQKNGIGIPEVSITLGYVQLSKTMEYPDALPEKITIGDTVTVDFEKMQVRTSARVVKTRYNVLSERHESVSIGTVKRTISDTISRQSKDSENLSNRVSAGFSAQGSRIGDAEKEIGEILFDMESLTADVGTAKAGLYLIASKDELETLKEARATLYSDVMTARANLDLLATSEELQNLNEAGATLYAKIDGVNSSLELYVTKSGLSKEQAFAKLATRVTGAEASITSNSQNINGIASSLVQISADIIKLKGDTEILGNLSIVGGRLKSSKGIISDNAIIGIDINANGTGDHGIVSGRRVSCTELAVNGQEFTGKPITSTSGTVRVLGLA